MIFRQALTTGCAMVALLHGNRVGASIVQPPLVEVIDDNQLNISSPYLKVQLPQLAVSVGTAESGLARQPSVLDNVSRIEQSDNFSGFITITPETGGDSGGPVYAYVNFSGKTYKFFIGNWYLHTESQQYQKGPYSGGYNSTLDCTNNSATSFKSASGICKLYIGDGTVVTYDLSLASINSYAGSNNSSFRAAYITSIAKGDGEVVQVNYQNATAPVGDIKTVWSSLGWMLKYEYASDGSLSKVSAINTSVAYCSPDAASCAPGYNYPYVSSSKSGTAVAVYRNGSLTGSYTDSGGSIETIIVSSPSGVKKTYNYSDFSDIDGRQYQTVKVSQGDNIWNYGGLYQIISTTYQPYDRIDYTRSNPDSSSVSWKVDLHSKIYSLTDQIGRTTLYGYLTTPGSSDLLQKITPPMGTDSEGYTSYGYTNSQISSETRIPRGVSLPQISRSWSYDCVIDVCLIKPTKEVDFTGNETDYEYSNVHGGLLKQTGPMDKSGVRSQTRYEYSQMYPKILDVSGNLVNSAPIYRVTRVSTCRTATSGDPASCVGTADEIVTTYAYDSNNLLKTSETISTGDGSLQSTTAYTYDNNGAVICVDGPRTDVDDKSYITYDNMGRKIFEIGPIADSGSSLPRLIIKHNYDADGREYLTQNGKGHATDGSDFTVIRFARNSYDAITGRLIKTEIGHP